MHVKTSLRLSCVHARHCARNLSSPATKIHKTFRCLEVNQKIRIGEKNRKSFKVVSKKKRKRKKKKKHLKGLSFITQFKIQILLPFTGCRKVLGKMPDIYTTYTNGES